MFCHAPTWSLIWVLFAVPLLCLWICHTFLLSMSLGRVLTNASASQDFSWMCSYSLVAFRPLSVSWQPGYNHASVYSDACCTCGPSRHSITECQEKQTPVPRPFLGPGQSIVIRRIWSVCNSCSVQPSSIALFYTMTSCRVSWSRWWSDAITHQCSCPSSIATSMKIDYQIFLAILLFWKPRKLVSFLACWS